MKLTNEQSRQILEKHGVWVNEACDKCGQLLGAVRFTIYGQQGVWCSRECRDGAEAAARYDATRHRGRPRKFADGADRQKAYRLRKKDLLENRYEIESQPTDSVELTDAKIASLVYPPSNQERHT